MANFDSLSRRQILQALSSVALGPLVGCQSSGGDGSTTQLAGVANTAGQSSALLAGTNSAVEPDPIIVLVPGFTAWLGDILTDVSKADYFLSQKADLATDRIVFDMNDVGDFDSDDWAIQTNAAAIALYLGELKNSYPDRGVTLVSHSKGGLDVLHALVELDNESSLGYRGGSAAPGQPIHRDLWDNLAGWVAFTSNFFESKFEIATGGLIPPAPATCILGALLCDAPVDRCSALIEASEYESYPFDPNASNKRPQYMHDHQAAIADLALCVPIINLYATYSLGSALRESALDELNHGIYQNTSSGSEGANDGLVPARASQLPGLLDGMIQKLPADPSSIGLNGVRCGVDHLAPAVDASLGSNRLWTESFRNERTREYIGTVESVPTAPEADAGPDQTVECESHEGTVVTLDGSASDAFHRMIVSYEWLEDDTVISTGADPALTFALGTHNVTLRVTDNCGAVGEDVVVITVEDTIPPEIDLVVNPTALWAPNHKMWLVARRITATDICDPDPQLVVDVTSNEPINGTGDGNTESDWEVVEMEDGIYVWSRAERAGTGDGRIYTITATATDSSGNEATSTGEVFVAHDHRN